ncbi:tetratricopeptide repeat protein [Kineobactrum salinum]|uniref:Tetratricopeptide repeat protein n=1 Tax=Kineobactrum salinum TaxID=2708301 RepID=A0A6C0TX47_9GAMM|nr:tetratricopeptide repeat protein [Kineobactrum salinum]QIB64093.1 tetratricopeptide repeat protein [Kineobactrum salinum]
MRLTTGRVFDSLGELNAASAHLQRAAELFERELGSSHPQTLASRYQLAITLSNASDYEQAAAVLGAADSDALVAGSNPEAELAAARAWGRWYLLQGRAAEAAPELEKAALAQRQLQPNDLQTLHEIRSDQAQAYNHMGRAEEAVALLQELQQPQYRRAASPARKASTDFLLGAALLYAERYGEAEAVLLNASGALDKIYGEDSVQSARARSALGNLYFTIGRAPEALPMLIAARATLCKLYGPQHQVCLQHHGNEGIARLQLGEDRQARQQLELAHGGFRERFGDSFTGTQVLAYYLAATLLAAGETEQAATLIGGLDPAILASGSPGAHWGARVGALAATLLLLRGQVDEAVRQLREAVAAMEAAQLQPWILAPFREYLRSGEAMLQAANKS